jgi:hypothetical protein
MNTSQVDEIDYDSTDESVTNDICDICYGKSNFLLNDFHNLLLKNSKHLDLDLKKYDWKIKKNLIEIILKNNGILFGGCVRDIYLHEIHSSKFYSKFDENYIITNEDYNNKHIYPETEKRMLIPTDIDAFMYEKDYVSFINLLKEKYNFGIRKIIDNNDTSYFNNSQDNIKHYKFEITPMCSFYDKPKRKIISNIFNKSILKMNYVNDLITFIIKTINNIPFKTFNLDLIVIKNENNEPPFGNDLDFECNGLLMDNNGLRLSSLITKKIYNDPIKKHLYLNRVLEDSLNNIAKCITYNENRFNKMLKKKWKIDLKSKNIDFIQESYNDGHCIICHDKCHKNHFKLKCCDSRYHMNCLSKMYIEGDTCLEITGKCPMCRNQKEFCEIKHDIDIINKIKNFKIFEGKD